MKSPQRILVIVDPTVSEHPEIDKAATIATRVGAKLQLGICTHASRDARPQTELQALLESLSVPLRERGLAVTTVVETAEVLHEGLIDMIRRAASDIVVKQTHHHSLLERTLLTNTDWHLIRDCPQPLLLTKDTHWPAAPTIMASVDPDHVHDKPAALDHAILEQALDLARQFGGALCVAHAYLPIAITALLSEGMAPLAGTITPEAMAQEAEAHRQRVRGLTEAYDIPESALRLTLGTTVEALPRLARVARADILVLGAVARSKLERLVIGSTAERVLERLPCDALIVKLTRRSSDPSPSSRHP